MKLWIDDERQPPDDTWHWVTTSAEAITCLTDSVVSVISLDHDLGGDDTTRPVIIHMCQEEIWPKTMYVHSLNPVGAHWIMQMLTRYAPPGREILRRSPVWR